MPESGAHMHLQEGESSENFQNQAMMITKDVATEIRMGFVRKVYGILSMQLLLTTIIAAPVTAQGYDFARANQWLIIFSSVMTIVLMCVMICKPQVVRTFPQNYIFLLLFTAFESILIGVVCASYTVQSVVVSVGITVLIFLAMTAYACFTKRDFSGSGPFIFAFFMVFIMFGFMIGILSLFGLYFPFLEIVYNCMGVLIFTFYIVFDTQRIMGEWGGHKCQFSIDDYVLASLTLYLDILNLFLYILALFGNRR